MTVFAALLSIATFMLCLKLFGVVKVSISVLATSRNAVQVMRDDAFNDNEREKIVQKASVQLLQQFFSIVVRVIGVLVASFVPIWLLSVGGLTTVDAVFEFLSRWDVIFVITAIMVCAYLAWVKWSKR